MVYWPSFNEFIQKNIRKFTPLIEFTPYQPERSWDTVRCPKNEFFCNENDRVYEREIMIFLK